VNVCMSDFMEQYRRSQRANRELQAAGIRRGRHDLSQSQFDTVQAIAAATDADLLQLRNIGPKVLAEIRAVVPHSSTVQGTEAPCDRPASDDLETRVAKLEHAVAQVRSILVDLMDGRTSAQQLIAWLEDHAQHRVTGV
jgi:hypothetical protein